MKNKKFIIAAAILAMLSTGFNPVKAENINLTEMDVKRSSVADTVDVTFYTTGQSSGSVVTRKSNNRYVVLLPNVSSTASVTPSIGGVKDLISDVEVKHVNDGIGGYTKITFSTTKPINIKTYTKRSNPITAAQKDYKNIIAQNNTQSAAAEKPAQQTKTEQSSVQQKPAQTQPKVEKTVANKTTKPSESKAEKPAVQKETTKTTQKPKLTPVDLPKNTKVVNPPKTEQVKPEQNQKPAETKTVTSSSDYVPKMKYDENGKRIIDLEPRISHQVTTTKQKEVENIQPSNESIDTVTDENIVAEDNNTKKSHTLPLWMLIAGGSILALGIFIGIINTLARNARRRKSLESFFSVSSSAKFTKPRDKYADIVYDSNLNWQEKYKRYSEKQVSENKMPELNGISYVTNLGATKKAVISEPTEVQTPVNTTPKLEIKPQVEEIKETKKPISSLFTRRSTENKPENITITEEKVLKGNTEEFKKQMRAKISQLEHSFAQTSSLNAPEENSTEVRSEDNSIISKISDVKLKSFSKPLSLSDANRGLLNTEKKTKPLQEGRFVKLKDSALSVNRRTSASSEINANDLINKGNKYLNNNNGEMKMTRENENYLLSSLDEYLSILDSEKPLKSDLSVADSLAQIKPASEPMSRSGVTNPISRTSNPISGNSSSSYMNGLIVKSGYNIDSEKGFYLVNMDGVSALVGRIKDSTYVLKKFDRVIDSPLQVRQDDASVYIVKVGRYKCLVDVAKDKMGTLIEI